MRLHTLFILPCGQLIPFFETLAMLFFQPKLPTTSFTLLPQEEKGLRYRAGFRQGDVRTPTEYQLQYTWKTPTFESPLLSAENVLHHSCHPTQIQTERREEADEPVEGEHRLGVSHHPRESPSEQDADLIGEEREVGRGKSTKDGGLTRTRKPTSSSKHEPPKSTSVSKSSKGKKRRRGSHHHPRKVSHHRRQFVSEYRAQFKRWPIAEEKKTPGEGVSYRSEWCGDGLCVCVCWGGTCVCKYTCIHTLPIPILTLAPL